jgi:hypothetical protein
LGLGGVHVHAAICMCVDVKAQEMVGWLCEVPWDEEGVGLFRVLEMIL